MDGGNVTSPSFGYFSPEGKWQIENHGVDPEVVVEQDPKAISEGHDPQLEKAVSLAVEDLAQHPAPVPQRPRTPTITRSSVAADQGLAAGVSVWA
jgi:tricorn protease